MVHVLGTRVRLTLNVCPTSLLIVLAESLLAWWFVNTNTGGATGTGTMDDGNSEEGTCADRGYFMGSEKKRYLSFYTISS